MTDKTKRLKNRKSSDFISKLLDMMQKYPNNIYWSQKGDQLIIENLVRVEEIFAGYFRHSKLASFTRQLNMYGFSKREKSQQILKFTHQIFKRGNQKYFNTIRRKSKQNTIPIEQCNNFQILQLQFVQYSKQQYNFAENEQKILRQMLIIKNQIQNSLKCIEQGLEFVLDEIQKQSNINQQIGIGIKQIDIQKIQRKLGRAQEINYLMIEEIKEAEMELKRTAENRSVHDQEYSIQQCSIESKANKNNGQEKYSEHLIGDIEVDDQFRFQEMEDLSDLY